MSLRDQSVNDRAPAFWGHHRLLVEQLTGVAGQRQVGLELGDAFVGRGRPGRPDTGLAALLCHQTPLPWVPRAWAALRYDEHREVNKKVHRLWREEGLQVKALRSM